jgi:hypothetical protein
LEIQNGFALLNGSSHLSVDHILKLIDATPSLHPHYRDFITVESEEVELICSSSVRSIKRLVGFSPKPLSFAAPPLESLFSETGDKMGQSH